MVRMGITAVNDNEDNDTDDILSPAAVAVTSNAALKGDVAEAEALAARDHRSCMGWWKGVLGRCHEKIQLVDPGLQKKFRVVNQGPWAQITASLADEERMNRRSFMTESEVRTPQSVVFLLLLVCCCFLSNFLPRVAI